MNKDICSDLPKTNNHHAA